MFWSCGTGGARFRRHMCGLSIESFFSFFSFSWRLLGWGFPYRILSAVSKKGAGGGGLNSVAPAPEAGGLIGSHNPLAAARVPPPGTCQGFWVFAGSLSQRLRTTRIFLGF